MTPEKNINPQEKQNNEKLKSEIKALHDMLIYHLTGDNEQYTKDDIKIDNLPKGAVALAIKNLSAIPLFQY